MYLVFTRILVEFMYPVFTHMPADSYRRRLRSLLLYLWYVFRELFIKTKHIMRIFGLIPFFKLQNNTEATVKR